MEKFIMAGTTAIRYRDIGIGDKVVVLLHGYLEAIEVWDDFGGDLGKEFRVVSFDLPGHGISEVVGQVHTMEFLADTLNALLERLDIGSVNVVGHSMGGYVALAFANKYSDKCDSITLFHSTPNGDTPEKRELREREIAIIESGRKEALTSIRPGKCFAVQNRKRYQSFIDESTQQAMLTEDEGIVAILRGMSLREDTNGFLQNSPIKQLFIFGRNDDFIPTEYAEKIAASNPQARVEWLETSGHMGFVEQRADSVALLREFINS